MALSEKILFRKFRNRPIDAADVNIADVWQGNITMSFRTDENAEWSTQREAAVFVSKMYRMICIEFLDSNELFENTFIKFHTIRNTASPTASTCMLQLNTRHEVIFNFGTPLAKSSFVEAITLYDSSSDSGNSET